MMKPGYHDTGKDNLVSYCLHLADNALILGHRNSEWCGHGPVLEQDIALTNIALDLVGQARNFYQYAASLMGDPATEDTLAFLRDSREYLNLLLVEQPNGDWGRTIMRQFLFSAYQLPLYQRLVESSDEQISAIAAKAVKETTYHLRWSSEWVIRLGDGTEESNQRMGDSIDFLWMYTGEAFEPARYETSLLPSGIAVDPSHLLAPWQQTVEKVFSEATLQVPQGIALQRGGKQGLHSESLGYLLAEMQYLQRAYPNSKW